MLLLPKLPGNLYFRVSEDRLLDAPGVRVTVRRPRCVLGVRFSTAVDHGVCLLRFDQSPTEVAQRMADELAGRAWNRVRDVTAELQAGV